MEENKLIRSILDGDCQAYAVLVNRYQRPVYNLMLRMTHSREEAADLTQDAFLKAYEKLEGFKPSHHFFPWLYAIALNLSRDWLRKRKTAVGYQEQLAQTALHAADDPAAVEKKMADQLDGHQVRRCLMGMPAEYREALMLRYHEGLPMQDVGIALGITTSGAKMRIGRGLEKLRTLFYNPGTGPGKQPTLSGQGDGK